ncbi:MAG: error-prone DNA polymerase, partial [Variibacter sp.]|nr:error-prone DNA polymerase [Variibacter sp.]
GILCQGRGSAANSTVCFCLGITSVDPMRSALLFERFISTEREEPPDIDVDFEHERREEVIQYIYDKYTRERAGIAATVISYRGRSAVREVGKVFGLSDDTIAAVASSIWGMGGGPPRRQELERAGIAADSPRIRKLRSLVDEIRGFPRHLSQHVGGFVITRGRLDEVVPLMNGGMDKRTHVEWDKDDLDALGILKVDVLGLGMLTCLRKAFELAETHYGLSFRVAPAQGASSTVIGFDLAQVPQDEAPVYDMLCRADSIGVFQVESRAQMSMLPRLRPRAFYDLVIEVAIVRPGPIQGDMVHPYLRRREALRERGEQPAYPSPAPGKGDPDELKRVLERTLGVPLFQEQAMSIAMTAGGFSAAEADKLRRAMATFKRTGTIDTFRDKMIKGMTEKGYDPAFAERCFSQIEGFGEYGFPESHAASFALLVYASAWLKCRYPDVFAAALVNAQPMGFYAPAQIIRDLREHGVEVRPVDINRSRYDATLERDPPACGRLHPMHASMRGVIRAQHALRLGLRAVKGLSQDDADRIVARRGAGYASVRDLWLRTGLPPRTLERLAEADAFGSLGLSRRQALWRVKALGRAGDQDDLPLLRPLSSPPASSLTARPPEDGADMHREPAVALPAMPLGEEVVNDYRFLSLSLRAHPASFLRAALAARGIMENAALRTRASGERVTVSGLVSIRQRPGSANGVVFMTIEDESGIANLIVWPATLERFRPVVLGARYVAAHGRLQHESGVIHVVVERLEDLSALLGRLLHDAPPIGALADDSNAATAEIAHDLAVTAPGSAHVPTRRG